MLWSPTNTKTGAQDGALIKTDTGMLWTTMPFAPEWIQLWWTLGKLSMKLSPFLHLFSNDNESRVGFDFIYRQLTHILCSIRTCDITLLLKRTPSQSLEETKEIKLGAQKIQNNLTAGNEHLLTDHKNMLHKRKHWSIISKLQWCSVKLHSLGQHICLCHDSNQVCVYFKSLELTPLWQFPKRPKKKSA